MHDPLGGYNFLTGHSSLMVAVYSRSLELNHDNSQVSVNFTLAFLVSVVFPLTYGQYWFHTAHSYFDPTNALSHANSVPVHP